TQSLQRTRRAKRPISNCDWIQRGEVDQRLCCNCTTLGMLLPFGQGAHFRGASTGVHYGLLEIALRPLSHHACNGRSVAGGAQNAFRRGTMGGGFGVESNPAVASGVIASDRIPWWRRTPADGPDGSQKPQGAHSAVDNNGGTCAMHLANEFRDGQRRRCYSR